MDKNTLIVLGFLFLCILLSRDKKEKEGFATINVSKFETACNADSNTCIVEATAAPASTRPPGSGGECLPSRDGSLYNLLPPTEADRDLHKETFNITSDSCDASGYALGSPISAQVCSSEGQEYTLSGCAAKCTNANQGGKPGYDVSLPQYVSPIEGNQGIVDIAGSCTDGLLPAINTCFNKDGTINGAETTESCTAAGGIWYDNSGNNSIKLVCDNPEVNPNYSVIGCEAACLSRTSALDEYMTTTEITNENKEIIQILYRLSGEDGNNTRVLMPQGLESPYQMNENNLNPGIFNVSGTPQTTNFLFSAEMRIPGSFSTAPSIVPALTRPIDFAGVVESSQGCNLSSPNTDLQRKYPVSGLFPVCDSQTHECLNFNITYDSGAPLNITDFKNTMNENASEIGIPPGELDNYKNSLYYYRRYKGSDDKTHIEGQIRCNNDPNSPFHCIITDEDSPVEASNYSIDDSGYCIPDSTVTSSNIGNYQDITVQEAIRQCGADQTCSGFTIRRSDNKIILKNNITSVQAREGYECHSKP
jgi:hypothetical protein